MKLLVACVALVLTTTVAHATNADEVTFWSDPDPVSNGCTDDLVTVSAWVGGTYMYDASVFYPCSGSGWAASYSFDEVDVSSVQIQTSGSDAYWIDEVDLGFYSGDSQVVEWGVENSMGWCLSTDASDGTGSWSDNIDSSFGCQSALEFRTNDTAHVYVGDNFDHVYTMEIDCAHSKISNEGSNDTITATFYNGSSVVGSQTLSKAKWCKYGASLPFTSSKTINRVDLSTDGDDAMFVDWAKLKVWQEDDLGFSEYTTVKKWGSNGGSGWCLSDDPDDSDGSWSSYINETSGGVKCGQRLKFKTNSSNATPYL